MRIGFTVAPRAESTLGAYRLGVQSGIIPAAVAANSELYQFRWAPTDTTKLALIRRVEVTASVSTTFFAAGVPVQLDMIRSTAWSVAGTGGTAVTVGTSLKRRTGLHQSSLTSAGDIRVATTAALGAGTKTLEANSLSFLALGGPITASLAPTVAPPGTTLWDAKVESGDYPLVLASQEGFSIRAVAVPATGTWTMAVNVDWVETSSY